jgi:O-antigen ligase
MILLGAQLIKEKPFTGAGPGGYATASVVKNKEFNMGTQRSPHNFPLEIISQYGLIGWIYFGFLGFVCISLVRTSNSFFSFENSYFYVVLCSLFFIWMMPSSFLLLEIHRLILPLFLLVLLVRKIELNNG